MGEVLLQGSCEAPALAYLDKAVALLPPGLEQQEKVSTRLPVCHKCFRPAELLAFAELEQRHVCQANKFITQTRRQVLHRGSCKLNMFACISLLPLHVHMLCCSRGDVEKTFVAQRRRRNTCQCTCAVVENPGITSLKSLNALTLPSYIF